jgi:hypothetical protein
MQEMNKKKFDFVHVIQKKHDFDRTYIHSST